MKKRSLRNLEIVSSIRLPGLRNILALLLCGLILPSELVAEKPMITETTFGRLKDGRTARLYTLENGNGMRAKITDYGAILVALEAKDRNGELADVTLGYDTLEGWLTNTSYFGATVGRFGNRIKGGRFSLDGEEYSLAANNHPGGIPCHLHGGVVGFDKVLWKSEGRIAEEGAQVVLSYLSVEGEEGYPGNLAVTVTYTLTEKDELIWEAQAETDAATIVNIVHHSYWNLSGDPDTSINDHQLTLFAGRYLPTDAGLIPTGERKSVEGTPMDFTSSMLIGARLDADYDSLVKGAGYDHAWVLDGAPSSEHGLHRAAVLVDPETGRKMEVDTNQPAVQFYGGNFLDGTVSGKGGVAYEHRSGLCLETENFPDAPNQPDFPTAVLRPGERYYHKMIHRFSAE